MEKFQRTEAIPEQLRYAVVPKPLLKRFIIGRSIRCAIYIVLVGLMLLPLSVFPGLALLVLPGEVALVSRIHDETELIRWVRHNVDMQPSYWDDAEFEAEMIRLRAHGRSGAFQGYAR